MTDPKNQNDEVQDLARERFQYQLGILKDEIEIIDKAIARLDEVHQTAKNWAVVTWTGSLAVVLGQPELRPYLIFTAIPPFFFWIIEVIWGIYQLRFFLREEKISEFLNDERLVQSFEQQKFVGIKLLDPFGRQYVNTDEYRRRINIRNVLKNPEVSLLYLSLALVSVVASMFFIPKN